jgi:hypothetical protein
MRACVCARACGRAGVQAPLRRRALRSPACVRVRVRVCVYGVWMECGSDGNVRAIESSYVLTTTGGKATDDKTSA